MRPRKYTPAENLISVLLGIALGALAGYGHLKSVENAPRFYYEHPAPVVLDVAWDAPAEIEAKPATVAPVQPEPETETRYIDPDIPLDVQEAAYIYGEEYDLLPEFLEAVAFAESSYDPAAVNGSCSGLMQVSIRRHRDRMERLGVDGVTIWEVDGNMHVAADYLAELFAIYDDPVAVLMYYNGDTSADDYLNGNAPASGYAEKIITMARELEEKHGRL